MRVVMNLSLALLLAAACGIPGRGGGSPSADLAADVAGVRFRNSTGRTVYYTAFEQGFAARANLAPCADPEHCVSVAPGDEAFIPASAIAGYGPNAREVVVHYWHLVPTTPEGGFAVEGLRSAAVSVPEGAR